MAVDALGEEQREKVRAISAQGQIRSSGNYSTVADSIVLGSFHARSKTLRWQQVAAGSLPNVLPQFLLY